MQALCTLIYHTARHDGLYWNLSRHAYAAICWNASTTHHLNRGFVEPTNQGA